MNILWRSDHLSRALQGLYGTRLDIASGYMSHEGADQVARLAQQNRLGRESVRVFLSTVFSVQAPSDILRALVPTASVFIVPRPGGMLHAKVIFADGPEPAVLLGSANLTGRGLGENLEFGALLRPCLADLEETRAFFGVCLEEGLPVSDAVIEVYDQFLPSPSGPEADRSIDALTNRLMKLSVGHRAAEQSAMGGSFQGLYDYCLQRGTPNERSNGDITFRSPHMKRNDRALTIRRAQQRVDIYINRQPVSPRFETSEEASFHVRVPIALWQDPEVLALIGQSLAGRRRR